MVSLNFGQSANLESATPVDMDALDAHYREHLEPLTEEYEARRVQAVADFKKRLPFAVGIFVAALALAGYLTLGSNALLGDYIPFVMVGVFFIGVADYFWANAPLSKFTESVQDDIYPRIFSFFGEDYHFSRTCPWSVSSLEGSDLIPSHDDEETEDYVRGSHNGVAIEMVEVRLTEESGSGKNKRTVEKFDGAFFLLTPKKKFTGKIVVKRDKGMIANTVVGFFKDKFQDLETVRLEDPEFEDKFEVYATDQIAARTVLTTSFMQRLLDLANLIGGKVDCSFFESKLLIRVATTKDFFAPSSPHEPVDFHGDFVTIAKEFQIVFDIIDTLKLEMDIGL